MNDLGQAAVSADKAPRTERGRRTVRKLLEAAAQEFGQRGYHEAAITGITARAGVALGTFYTYFESKEELFRALVQDMSHATRSHVAEAVAGAPDRLTAERLGLAAFIAFTRKHPELYRIIEEAQFVADDVYREHYRSFVEGYRQGLASASARGEIAEGPDELRAWALIGMSVFLGMRYAIWDRDMAPTDVADAAIDLVSEGLEEAIAMIPDMPNLIAKRAALSPRAIALEEAVSGRTRTYAELDARAGQVAAALAARGVSQGDRVAILCRTRIAFFELLFGCAKLGAVLVPLNWRMPPAELDSLIADCEPKLLLYGASDAETVARLAAPPPALGLDDGYDAALAAAGAYHGRQQWRAADTWYLLYTSGTTGRPKGVIYTYRMAVANYVNIGAATGLRATDTTVSFLPNFHTAGINLHALPVLIAGGRVMLLEAFDAEALVGLIEAERLDTVFAVPTVYQALLDHPRFAAAPLAHVRHWGCGGAPLPDVLVERYRDLGVRVCNGMGMTETGPTAFLVDPADAWDRIGSVGKPQLLCSARIVDADGRDLPNGEVGDLLFSGPGVTPGYWRNEEATRAAFTADGWLRSGDLARRDADGFFYVAGRRKEMFISGGENVYPVEVENVLAAHPSVIDVAVLSRPDPRWGEVGRAFVQLAPDRHPDRDELAAYCRSRLAPYKVPVSFEFVAEFPRTPGGKIQKHLLA